MKIRIMFLCHGNICRSPMAEFILKKLVRDADMEGEFRIASAATSMEEIGNDIYPPAQRSLRFHNIPFDHRHSRIFTAREYDEWDLLICMDSHNLRNLARITPDPEHKVRLLMSYTGEDRDVADPWYSGEFEITYRDIEAGCQALFHSLQRMKDER